VGAFAYNPTAGHGERHTIDIAVLVSGSGSNLQALIDRLDPSLSRISLVLSDRESAFGLERARAAGIPTAVIPWKGDRTRFTTEICDALERAGVQLIVLAGFMRILGPEAIERFPDRILNIHPSLLPAFPGAHALEDALEHGVKVTGVTIHFVDEKVDHGPIVVQEAVDVLDGDTAETLHTRIQAAEHRLYPVVVDAFCAGRLQIEGRKVIWR
jgi:phosphoribosylglycinamide formyltransferase-1